MGWYYRYKDRSTGKLVAPFVIGKYPAMSHDEARVLVRTEMRPLADAGRNVKHEWKRLQSGQKTKSIRQLIPEYLAFAAQEGRAAGTIVVYRRYLRPLAHWWSDRLPNEITRGDVQDLFHRVRADGVPPYDIDGTEISGGHAAGGDRAAGHTLSVGRAFWTYLVDREKAEYNPWKDQKKLAQTGQSGIAGRALNDKDIRLVLHSQILNIRDRTILRLMLATGLRPTECLGAQWREFNLHTGVWKVPAERMKHKKQGHTVHLSSYALDVLQTWRKQQKGHPRYLFPVDSDKRPHVSTDNIRDRFHKLGVEGFNPKVCRSTFRTGLQALGCPKEVREHMSHHHPADKISQSYDHHDYGPEAKTWWQKWGEHLVLLENGNVVLMKERRR
tara:strand:+ start:9180 stop:10337 length:1158 start_codon:yes stop_codon:yes gene_type:complete